MKATSLADRVKGARTRAGLSQVELARVCGVSPSLVCTLESGRTKSLRHSTLLRMAEALGQSPEWLAFGRRATPKYEQAFLADFHRLPAAERRVVARMVHDLVTK